MARTPFRCPKDALRLTSFAEMDRLAEDHAAGRFNGVLLVGDPGLGKTRTFQQACGERTLTVSGHLTPFQFYRDLWAHRDADVLIDDLDALTSNPSLVGLLKSLCATEPVKRLAWRSAARQLEEENIPTAFDTRSRVVILANEWGHKGMRRDVVALEDRLQCFVFRPSACEVHRRVQAWFTEADILDFFADWLPRIARPSMRLYVRAAELKAAGWAWREKVLELLLPPDLSKLALVAALKAEPFPTEEDRAREFTRRGGGSRATYFRWVERLPTQKAAEVSAGPGL